MKVGVNNELVFVLFLLSTVYRDQPLFLSLTIQFLLSTADFPVHSNMSAMTKLTMFEKFRVIFFSVF